MEKEKYKTHLTVGSSVSIISLRWPDIVRFSSGPDSWNWKLGKIVKPCLVDFFVALFYVSWWITSQLAWKYFCNQKMFTINGFQHSILWTLYLSNCAPKIWKFQNLLLHHHHHHHHRHCWHHRHRHHLSQSSQEGNTAAFHRMSRLPIKKVNRRFEDRAPQAVDPWYTTPFIYIT